MSTHYETLGINDNAEPDAIRTAWKRVARDTHPDRNPDDPKALERFLLAKEAYETLSDEGRRAVYDTEQQMAWLRFEGRTRCASCGATVGPAADRCVRCAILEHRKKTAEVVARTRAEMVRLQAEMAAERATRAEKAKAKARETGRVSQRSIPPRPKKKPIRTIDFGLGADILGRYRLDDLFVEAPIGLSSTGLLEALLSEAAIRSSLGAVDPARERAGQTVVSFTHGDTQVQLKIDPTTIRDVNGTLRSAARVMAAIRRLVG
jgi:ribosomal protein L40E